MHLDSHALRSSISRRDYVTFNEHRPDLKSLDDLDREIHTELFNAVLFASDDVITSMSKFIHRPDYSSYVSTATAMRRDLWNKKTSIDEAALNVASRTVAPEKDPSRVGDASSGKI